MKSIDCMGEICPLPVMKLKREFVRSKPGDEIMLITDHSCVPASVSEFCRLNGHGCVVVEAMNGVWELSITVFPGKA